MSISAFPIAISANCISWEDGMTLRDYFAGQVLVGIMTGSEYGVVPEKTATWCYKIADAMIEAREQIK